MIIIFDLDQTLVNTDIAFSLRKQGKWNAVYQLIPQMNKYPCIDEIYQFLLAKGIKMALVSSSPKSYCSKVLSHFGLNFEVIVAYHDTSLHKPNPHPYIKAIELLQVPKENVYAIGDDVNDIIAAKKAEIKSIGCGWGSYNIQNLKDSKPVYYFSKPEELLQFLLTHFNSI